MTDFAWPESLAPYVQSFWLQPHVGRSESPFTRQQKVYGLSAPRWVSRLSVRGGSDNRGGLRNVGGGMDGFIAKLKGGTNRVWIYDFRRPARTGPAIEMGSIAGGVFTFDGGETFDGDEGFVVEYTGGAPSSLDAANGATTIVFTGYQHGRAAFLAGDYIGGDGRAHVVTDDAVTGPDGQVTVHFEPPLSAALSAGMALIEKVSSPFRLVADDAGANPTEVGQASIHDLELIEDL